MKFVIAGAQKCATTSLYEYFKGSGVVALPDIKEVSFFCDDQKFGDFSCRDYYFPEGFLEDLRPKGFAYVNLMYYAEKSIPRIMESFGSELKYIVVLRDPCDRAYSAYKYALSRGWENIYDPEAALDPQREEDFTEYWQYSNLTYLKHSLYGKQLEIMLEHISPSQLLVIKFDDLTKCPEEVVSRCLEWIGCDLEDSGKVEYKVFNGKRVTRFGWLQKIIMLDNPIKDLYQKIMPRRARWYLNKVVVRPLEDWNISGRRGKTKITEVADRKVFEERFLKFEEDLKRDQELLKTLPLNWLEL